MLLIHAAAIEVIRAMTAENKILLLENNLTDSLNIDELDEEIFQSVLALGRNILQRILEKTDRRLAGLRDKEQYRDKGKRTTTLKTLMGDVTFQRCVYHTKKGFAYLLDEKMDLNSPGLYSRNVCKLVVETACTNSYRDTARIISSTTGLSITAESAWRIVQEAGAQERERLANLSRKAKNDHAEGGLLHPCSV